LPACGLDWNHAVIEIDDRDDYGELRGRATGFMGAALCVLVSTRRGEHTRIINLRKAAKKEATSCIKNQRQIL